MAVVYREFKSHPKLVNEGDVLIDLGCEWDRNSGTDGGSTVTSPPFFALSVK